MECEENIFLKNPLQFFDCALLKKEHVNLVILACYIFGKVGISIATRFKDLSITLANIFRLPFKMTLKICLSKTNFRLMSFNLTLLKTSFCYIISPHRPCLKKIKKRLGHRTWYHVFWFMSAYI